MLSRWLPDPEDRAVFRRWALIALALHLIAAVFTEGWYAFDEHWQVIEFASKILGRARADELAWEYAARIRPSLQPFIYAGIERIFLSVGINNPFKLAAAFRIASSLAAWSATVFAAAAAARWFPASPARRWVMPALTIAWFVPYLHARTSSENASETAFVVAFALLTLHVPETDDRAETPRLSTMTALAIGLFFGLACEFRYQVGFMIAGACLWCVLVARLPVRTLALIATGLLTSVAVGTIADRLFYGVWTVAPANYFQINVLEHKASSFGTAPWWAYFPLMVERIGPPLSVVFVAGVFWQWVRRPNALATWCMVPFLVVHMALGHKEFRFLYPLATLSVLLVVRSASDMIERWPSFSRGLARARWARILAVVILTEDLGLLAIASVRPSQAAMPLYHRLYELGEKPVTLLYRDEQPYRYVDLDLRFYKPPELTLTPVASYAEVEDRARRGDAWFVLRGFDLPAEAGALAQECTVTARSMPPWVKSVDVNHWVERTPVWTLFRCSAAGASKS
jgi:phosphatidylinositol glycan class B